MAAFTQCETDAMAVAALPRVSASAAYPAGNMARTEVIQRWFAATQPYCRVTMGNQIVSYVYGLCAFEDMASAIASANLDRHQICLTGWWIDPGALLFNVPGSSLLTYLSNSKARIRALLYDPGQHTYSASPNNTPIVTEINRLPNGAAILDSKLPYIQYAGTQTNVKGAHHQKLLVVNGQDGLIAFLGGLDINNTRVQQAPNGSDQPYHDVHLRITGPAAADVLKVFRERWLDHPESLALDARKFQLGRAAVEQEFSTMAAAPSNPVMTCTEPSTKQPRSYYNNCQVSIGRTYANLQKFTKPPNNAAYAFIHPPVGEETAWQLISKGIQSAQRFIYIEDQYFVSRRLKALLISKLQQQPQFEFLLILMHYSRAFENDPSDFKKNEFPFLIPARNDIRAALKAIDPAMRRWGMYFLKGSNDPDRSKWCGSYVHSKTMIFDDECAIVGSANANDRGYTFDTEVVACVTDDAIGRAFGRPFARDLRMKLWHKHLGVPHAQVADWRAGLNLWKNPPPASMIVDASAPEFSPLMGGVKVLGDDTNVERLWRESIDPDADTLP